ncbi:hypothetical protein GASC598I20_018630 [Gilliamella apicola SCGC AB-598-I20]|nr:hypothetical protein GASC598I20_018630 [Gilliamella apicola SCGC AB-598-I20]
MFKIFQIAELSGNSLFNAIGVKYLNDILNTATI